ncbi:iron transporter [Halosolutus gelatinilyticus]|uniref:iron transporter n=1 Tax=Halosolutus gelatinilyticus TaxID=2931975 RepID=UPI001FF24D83|nr:iron transporter [Halosolutus gelatinilyticus]
MHRRGFLRGSAVAIGAGFAGCLERLGFEERSAWSNPPLVEDRPDAVYLPAGSEGMGSYGSAHKGDYALEVTYTIPHRFWIPGEGGSMVDVETDDSLHLMFTPWDVETDTVLPVDMQLEILRDDEPIDGVGSSPWPMLSQRMGFHYGDNVPLPEAGNYTARVRLGPVGAARTGALEGRLDSAETLSVEFDFDPAHVHDIDIEPIDEDRRGEPGALPLMTHGDHGDGDHGDGGHGDGEHDGHDDHEHAGGKHDPGPAPTSRGPPVDELSGDVLGGKRSADAKLFAVLTDGDRFTDEPSYLAVLPRTPYNDVILPFTALSVRIERGGTALLETPLVETLDHEFGHHYGTGTERLERGDEITITVDSPPQVSRHDGYETAFFDFEDVTYTV